MGLSWREWEGLSWRELLRVDLERRGLEVLMGVGESWRLARGLPSESLKGRLLYAARNLWRLKNQLLKDFSPIAHFPYAFT